jgi:DNA (cytosine-5)-methyltransferase 1
MIIDNFAGGGGASEGIVNAIHRPVDVAINHDHEAIAMHRANHPHTKHLTESVWKVEPERVTEGRTVRLGWFSPDCTHFSKAKGGKPVEKKIRGLANIVTRWGASTDMRLFILENVEEFQGWGPVSADGIPIAARKGELFKRWWGRLQDLGYHIEMRLITACDYGAPTSRTRLFVIGRNDGLPIYWPEPAFGGEIKPYRTAAECIDWSIPCPSIFTPGRNLVDNTLRRIARGVVRYVINNPRPFIVPLTHHGSPDRVYDINEPFRTITGAHRGEFALASPTLIQTGYGEREGQAPRCLDIQKPLGTVVAQGNKHALVQAFLARHYGGHENDGQSLETPFHTVTTQDHHALVTAHIQRDFGQSVGQDIARPLGTITGGGGAIVKFKGTCRDGQAIDEPLHTIQSGGLHYAQVNAFLLKYYGTDQNPQLELPLSVVTTKDRFALVTVHGEEYAIVDIGMRMLTPRELFRAQGFRDSYVIDPLVPDKRVKKSVRLIPLPKTGQVRMCGNSVVPQVAEALVAANYQEGAT